MTTAALQARGAARAAVLCLLAVVVSTVTAGPAQAHGRSSDATNYDSRIVDVPGIDGVTWQVFGGDEFLAVDNASGTEITVLGYEGEPWLRVGPEGVFRNELSTATYVNADRYAQAPVPPDVEAAGPDAEPVWEKVSDGRSWYWHDHRTHWMSPTLPPVVRASPDETVVVNDWEVPVAVGGEVRMLAGQLLWVPAPSPLPWLGAGLLLSLPALAGLLAGPGAPARLLARPAAVVVGAVGCINLLHLADDLFAAPAPLSATLLAALQTAIFIAVTLFGAVRGWQAGDGAFTALGVGSAAAFVGQGLLYLPALTSSQLSSLAPDAIGRLVIGLSLAQLVPVGLVAVIGTRRLLPPVGSRVPPEEAPAPG